jgi:ketosteroid isomerase-like protein
MTTAKEDPLATIDRLVRATNGHDLEGIVSSFADDYSLEAPLHPARSFRGKEQVRRNWAQILGAVPDIAVRVLRSARDGATAWTEWEMTGTRADGARHLMRGVFIFGVSEGLVRWGRMFLEPVDQAPGDMDDAVRAQVGARGGSVASGS